MHVAPNLGGFHIVASLCNQFLACPYALAVEKGEFQWHFIDLKNAEALACFCSHFNGYSMAAYNDYMALQPFWWVHCGSPLWLFCSPFGGYTLEALSGCCSPLWLDFGSLQWLPLVDSPSGSGMGYKGTRP